MKNCVSVRNSYERKMIESDEERERDKEKGNECQRVNGKKTRSVGICVGYKEGDTT